MNWLELNDEALLDQCAVDTYRASGPGGQKRNKTSSAVRLRHKPTGLIVTASESRSQHENKARALRRLREAIALTQRQPVSLQAPPPDFVLAVLRTRPGLKITYRHPDYWRIIQWILDVLAARAGSVAETAATIGISTGQLVRFLQAEARLWQQVNRMREQFGLHPLT